MDYINDNQEEAVFQRGDAFGVNFVYREDHLPRPLQEGYQLIVGLYDEMGRLLKAGRTSDETITLRRDGTYTMQITHEDSMKMIGRVTMEITIASDKNEVVDHSANVVKMRFVERKNNQLLNKS